VRALAERLTADPRLWHDYVALRSRLRLATASSPLRSLLVTSSQPREGKTTTLLNLGLVTLLAGRRVALLDADLRRPRLHELLGLPDSPGLTDLLAGRACLSEVVHAIQPPKLAGRLPGGLSVITAGRGAAILTDLLGGAALKETVRELRENHDILLVDSPPVLAADDACVLAPLLDGVVLVVASGVAVESDLKLTKARLEEAGAQVLGAVMNRFDPRLHGPATLPYSAYYY